MHCCFSTRNTTTINQVFLIGLIVLTIVLCYVNSQSRAQDTVLPAFRWGLITTMPCQKVLGKSQRAAFASWKKLMPQPEVLLLSECIPAELESQVTLISSFDKTFDGQPLFSGMMFTFFKKN